MSGQLSKLCSEPGPKDLKALLRYATGRESACKAITAYILAHPPSEDDPIVVCSYVDMNFGFQAMQAGVQNPKAAIAQGMTANGAVDIGGLGVAFHFESSRALHEARYAMQATHLWAFYGGQGAAQKYAGQAQPVTIETACIVSLVGRQPNRETVGTDGFRFFEL